MTKAQTENILKLTGFLMATALVTGFLYISGWARLVFILVNLIALITTTSYAHRSATHGAVEYGPKTYWGLRLGFWITTGQYIYEWVGVHRWHHSDTEGKKDPHSPANEGIWQIQILNFLYYVRAARQSEKMEKFARDIKEKEDTWDRVLFCRGWLGLLVGIVVLCLLLGPVQGLIVSAMHATLYVFFQTSSVNGLCHFAHWGAYQSNPVLEYARTVWNDWIIGLFTGGEGWHYNHHVEQKSARLSRRRSEPDLGWYFILVAEYLGGATNVERPKLLLAA